MSTTNTLTLVSVNSIGMAVALFTNKATHKKVLLVLEQISKRFPSVNFLKVGLFYVV